MKDRHLKKEKVINKLFLVGNGFDLALNLKTKYSDFLFWLLKTEVIRAIEAYPKLVKAEGYTLYNRDYLKREQIYVYGFSKNELFDVLVHSKVKDLPKKIDECENLTILLDELKTFKIKITPVNEGALFTNILESSTHSWIDIEAIYFKLLKDLFKSEIRESIVKLNRDLVYLTQLLKDYLTQLDISKTTDKTVSQKYIKQFISPIVPTDVIYPVNEHIIKSDRYYFLNFNYTKTLSNILLSLPDEYFKNYGNDIDAFVSHIHGDIDREEIVFGYGDEMDKDYKGIEDLNDNRFFENIKSFKYNKAYEYRDLLRFLNSGEYQVVIYGHSCGLSDRLLLNEVFEHDNCKSIKIYYYDEAEFTTKTMDISRHFNSNQLMRQKIVEFNEENNIPQT